MFRVSTLIVFLVIGLGVTDHAWAHPQAKPQTPGIEEEAPPILSVPKGYRYIARGRRDPFINPVPKPAEKAPEAPPVTIRPPGLKGVLVAEATIAGVVTSSDPSMTIVIIGAPRGNKYFARVGDALYDAVVREITFDTVKFALTAPGGLARTREIVRPVRPTSGEQK